MNFNNKLFIIVSHHNMNRLFNSLEYKLLSMLYVRFYHQAAFSINTLTIEKLFKKLVSLTIIPYTYIPVSQSVEECVYVCINKLLLTNKFWMKSRISNDDKIYLDTFSIAKKPVLFCLAGSTTVSMIFE